MAALTVRQAAVAGLFYEAEPAQLQAQLSALLGAAHRPAAARPRALVVPHAGYSYSGATAAHGYQQLKPYRDSIRRVLLLGPAHRVYLKGIALPGCERFASPLGEVAIDRDFVTRAMALPGVCESAHAHELEHSLEVQLPFLQAMLGEFTLLPAVVGDCPATTVAHMIDSLWEPADTLLVVSSDLSHFHNQQQAQAMDSRTCERLLQHEQHLSGDDACGARALNGLMASRAGQALTVTLLHRCTSGDSTGDHQRVVGYAAFSLH